MTALRERYMVDWHGNRIAVVIDFKEYQRIMKDLEELESIRAYDLAKTSNDESISFEDAINEIERDR